LIRSVSGGSPEDNEQWNRGKRCDQEQLVVVDVRDDLCLLREDLVERSAPCGARPRTMTPGRFGDRSFGRSGGKSQVRKHTQDALFQQWMAVPARMISAFC